MKQKYIHWGRRIKEVIKKSGQRQSKIAKGMNISPQVLSGWIKKASPNLKQIQAICDYLYIPIWEFFKPEGMSTEALTPEEIEWLQPFKHLPRSLQVKVIDGAAVIIESFELGLDTKTKKL